MQPRQVHQRLVQPAEHRMIVEELGDEDLRNEREPDHRCQRADRQAPRPAGQPSGTSHHDVASRADNRRQQVEPGERRLLDRAELPEGRLATVIAIATVGRIVNTSAIRRTGRIGNPSYSRVAVPHGTGAGHHAYP
jgi:hypothetical protein